MTTIPEGICGEWRVERFTIPKHSIEGLRCAMHGRPVVPGVYTRLMHGHGFDSLVMSDTPAEINDLWPLFDAVRNHGAKRVLINGLGLGVALCGVLKSATVEHVDVVEISPDVASLVYPYVKDNRTNLIIEDALLFNGNGSRWDVVWHDIWTSIPNDDDRKTVATLKRKYARKCKWQGVWCEQYLRR